jgi:alkanesulfonate monooxygenase SsuD/methylene tetrahydromethanopterin reductase-like flavin-dependent oxidoreductase (luciferase family)
VRLGDGWCPASHNPRYLLDTPERYGDGLARLRQVSEQAGRDPAEIHHGLFATRPLDPEARIRDGVRDLFTGSAAEIAGDLCAYRDQGVQTMICSIISPDLNQVLERIDWLARDIAPLVRG